MATFLMSTDGTNGDVLPFIRLGEGLTRRGHEVILHTHEPYAAATRQAGLGFVATETAEDYSRWQTDGRELWLNVLANTDHLASFYERHRLWDQIRREYEAMARVIGDRPAGQVVVVGRHITKFTPLLVREAFGVPTAWVGVTPTQYMATSLSARVYARTIGAPMNDLRATLGLPPVTDWDAWLSSADLLLGLWPGWFDTAGEPAPPAAALTGFVLHDAAEHGPLPPEVTAMVAGRVPPAERPVLITGGSGQMLRPDWYPAAVEACARAGRAGIVVCRYRDLLPDTLPAGMCWQPSLPFGSLIPKVAAVLHHGGVLTGARAIVSGVPQVILAHGFDRSDNAARLRRLGVAEWLPAARWNPTDVAALLTRVLGDPAYRERTAALTPPVDTATAVAAACDRLEALVGAGAERSARSGPAGPRQTSLRELDGEPEHHATGDHRSRVGGLSTDRRELLSQWLQHHGAGSRPAARMTDADA